MGNGAHPQLKYACFLSRTQGAGPQHCYSLLTTVHGLWRPIRGEFDDYIANPK